MKDPKVTQVVGGKVEIYNLRGEWKKSKFEQLKKEAEKDGEVMVFDPKKAVTRVVRISLLSWAEQD